MANSVSLALSSDEASERIAKEIGVISKDNTAVHDTTSQSDGRPTAIAVGAGACIFMAIVMFLLLVLDLTTITSHLKIMKRNLSGVFSGFREQPIYKSKTEASPSWTDLNKENNEVGSD